MWNEILPKHYFKKMSSQSSQIVDWRAEGLRERGPQNTKALSPSSAFR